MRILLLCLPLGACGPGDDGSPVDGVRARSWEPLALRLPVHDGDLDLIESAYVMGVDHDPEKYPGTESWRCLAYDGSGYPSCYDNHDGTDFDLEGGFEAMDEGSARIVAAAPGEVIDTVDGNYDRCRLDLSTYSVDCDGHEAKANLVTIEHQGGWITTYKHMAKDSVAVEVGDFVERGDVLGLIGSSGWSSAPHVHIELKDGWGGTIDPFAGEFSQEVSYWCDQDGPRDMPGTECLD